MMDRDKKLVRASERKLLEPEILNKKFKEFDRMLKALMVKVEELDRKIANLEVKGIEIEEISSTPREIGQGSPEAL